MTQDELWASHYHEIFDFITEQKRRPSKHRKEEHSMLDWFKAQRKLLAKDKLKPERVEKMNLLLELANRYLRKNQYAYTNTKANLKGFCGDMFEEDDTTN